MAVNAMPSPHSSAIRLPTSARIAGETSVRLGGLGGASITLALGLDAARAWAMGAPFRLHLNFSAQALQMPSGRKRFFFEKKNRARYDRRGPHG
jgi:hypothetical protein